MSATLSTTEAQAFESLRLFLLGIVPDGTQVFEAQGNRVPEPSGTNFITMTPSSRGRLSTNVTSYDSQVSQTASIEQSTQVDIQLDVHGPASADNSQIISTLMRDAYASDAFASIGYGVAPLYSTDPKQVPFINGESQYENRWTMMAALQVNPAVTLPQQFYDSIDIEMIEVDATYPPS